MFRCPELAAYILRELGAAELCVSRGLGRSKRWFGASTRSGGGGQGWSMSSFELEEALVTLSQLHTLCGA